jgi:hypothetical protein
MLFANRRTIPAVCRKTTISRSMMHCGRLIITTFLVSALGAADTVAFHKSKIIDGKQREAAAELIFNRDSKSMVVRLGDHVIADDPYDSIDKLSYEFSKTHRIKQGAIVMVASLGAGAVVMLTKSKSHWLYCDYKASGAVKSIVVKLDKHEYKDVLATAQHEIGKTIENIADAGVGRAK